MAANTNTGGAAQAAPRSTTYHTRRRRGPRGGYAGDTVCGAEPTAYDIGFRDYPTAIRWRRHDGVTMKPCERCASIIRNSPELDLLSREARS